MKTYHGNFCTEILTIISILLFSCSSPKNPVDAGEEIPVEDTTEDLSGEPVFDGQGCPQYDADRDTIPNFIEGEDDLDGDTIPNYLDEDSDGDTILDRHEAGDFDCGTPPIDTDEDETPDYLDVDSDNDTILDSEEAGDSNLQSYPRDTDELGTPDFRDIDSDNDGLSDIQERESGTNPYDSDSDHDGFKDIEEIASQTGDPLDSNRTPSPDEDFITLWYKGRSIYRIYNATVRYVKNDVFFIIDDTVSANEVYDVFKNESGSIYSLLGSKLSGLKVGIGVFSGWGMPHGIYPPECYHPFYGFLTMNASMQSFSEAINRIPICPEPARGSSVLSSLFGSAGPKIVSDWSHSSGDCNETTSIGAACFRKDARRFIFLTVQEDFPTQEPEGTDNPKTIDDAISVLNQEGIHTVGFIQQNNPYGEPYGKISSLARQTNSIDRTMRPLVYLTGSDGTSILSSLENAIRDIDNSLPSNITLEKEDGADWPHGVDTNGDGENEDFDATNLVSTIYPRGWSPPPGVAPSEAVSHIDGITYVRTIPGTEVSYKVYFRNYSLEQGLEGFVFDVKIKIVNDEKYIFNEWKIKIIVPCIAGDSQTIEP